jgi:PAS domain S-box-containing protein
MNNNGHANRINEPESSQGSLMTTVSPAILQKEMSFRQAIENSIPCGIAVVDDKGKQVYVNQSFCKMFGWTEDELLGKQPPYLYWARQDIENINKAMVQTLENKAPKEGYDLVFCHKSGKLIPVNVIISSFVQEDNKTFWLASVIDLTERKQAEMALKESETKFREIINQIDDIIIVFDKEGKIVIWNKGAENICGLKADEMLNKRIVDVQYQFTPPPNKDMALIESTINNIITFQTPEIFNQILDSEIVVPNSKNIRNIQSKVFPIELNGSHLFCTVIRDTTEIKQYEKEILRISADKDKFYSIIAQYLYNPFNLFHNFSKMMAEELDSMSIKEIQKMVVTMSKSATNLFSLLDNMLQFTRINQGKIAFNPQMLSFKKTCQDAVAILKTNADAKNIRIKHSASDELTVFADVFMLKTILRNLVSNAIKFSDNEGHVEILAHQTQSEVTISILDNGIGISPEYLKKLFNISQIHTTLGTAEEKGTTLGLLLCKEFVEKHGGKIWVESNQRKGSEFKFTLPVSASQAV